MTTKLFSEYESYKSLFTCTDNLPITFNFWF